MHPQDMNVFHLSDFRSIYSFSSSSRPDSWVRRLLAFSPTNLLADNVFMAQALVVIGEILGSMYIMRPMLLASAAYLRVRTHLRRPLAIIMAARSVPALRKKLARALSSSPAVPPVSRVTDAERIRSDCLLKSCSKSQRCRQVCESPQSLLLVTL